MRLHSVLAAIAIVTTGFFAESTAAQAPMNSTPTSARNAVATVKGGKIHYQVIGNLEAGTPLVILHGAYMTGDGMKRFSDRFSTARAVIVVDQRGHGRTGDIEGPITYELLADDAAAVIKAAGVKRADVFGYSMGGAAAIQLAIRHPELVGKLVSVSASYQSDAMYPELLAGIAQMTPSMFEGTPIKREYEKLSPTPKAFPTLVAKLKVLDTDQFDWSAARIKGIAARTMIVAGDYDVVRPEHAVDIFRMRGGGDPKLATAPVLAKAPPAQLAILPGTSHLGILAQSELIVSLVTPFLDDAVPSAPTGFF